MQFNQFIQLYKSVSTLLFQVTSTLKRLNSVYLWYLQQYTMSSYLSGKARMKRLDITDDDSKVLGKTPVRFLSQSAEQFSSKKFMTHHSAWTPVNHKPSNEQVNTYSQFLLVSHSSKSPMYLCSSYTVLYFRFTKRGESYFLIGSVSMSNK